MSNFLFSSGKQTPLAFLLRIAFPIWTHPQTKKKRGEEASYKMLSATWARFSIYFHRLRETPDAFSSFTLLSWWRNIEIVCASKRRRQLVRLINLVCGELITRLLIVHENSSGLCNIFNKNILREWGMTICWPNGTTSKPRFLEFNFTFRPPPEELSRRLPLFASYLSFINYTKWTTWAVGQIFAQVSA